MKTTTTSPCSVLVLAVAVACGGPAQQTDSSHSSGGTPTGVQVLTVAEAEPNNGATQAQVQNLGDFGAPLELRITGTLSTGGFDAQAQRYQGDLDTFAFTVTTPGNFSVSVSWPEDADVDVLLVTNAVVASDTTANKPARMANALSGGTFGLVIASATHAATYVATIRFDPLPAAGSSSSSSSSSGGPATTLDAQCTYSSSYGLDKVYIFWPTGEYVHNYEYNNIGTWERMDDGAYGIQGSTILFAPNNGPAVTYSFQQNNNVEYLIDGDLYLCFAR